MAKKDFVVGLDIGTTKICAIVGKKGPGEKIDILGMGTNPSLGLRKGMIIDLENATKSVTKVLREAEATSGLEISGVYAGIAGGHIRGMNSSAVVPVTQAGKEITSQDVERAIRAAQAMAIPTDREVIHSIIQDFSIDDQEGIKQPVGMRGVKLEVRIHIVLGAVAAVQHIIKSVKDAAFRVENIILQPLASAEAVFEPGEKELGVVLVDIGGGTSDITLFLEGNVWHTAVLSVGGDQVTNDIAAALSIPFKGAEKIKKNCGSCLSSLVGEEETFIVPGIGGRKDHPLKRMVLVEIIRLRMEEIFSLVEDEIEKSGYADLIKAGVVITGGASLMEGAVELAEEAFGVPVRLGLPRGVNKSWPGINSPIYATGVGLVMRGLRCREEGPLPKFANDNTFNRVTERMKEWLKEFF